MTALHRAALYGTEAAVRLLLRAGARPELRNKEGQSCIEISTAPEIRRLVQASQVPPLPPLLLCMTPRAVLSLVDTAWPCLVIAALLVRSFCPLLSPSPRPPSPSSHTTG